MSKLFSFRADRTFAGGDFNVFVFNRTFCGKYTDVYYYITAHGCEEIRQNITEKLTMSFHDMSLRHFS